MQHVITIFEVDPCPDNSNRSFFKYPDQLASLLLFLGVKCSVFVLFCRTLCAFFLLRERESCLLYFNCVLNVKSPLSLLNSSSRCHVFGLLYVIVTFTGHTHVLFHQTPHCFEH